jgi:hypothetical protein
MAETLEGNSCKISSVASENKPERCLAAPLAFCPHHCAIWPLSRRRSRLDTLFSLCLLLAQSGLSERARHMSALGGKLLGVKETSGLYEGRARRIRLRCSDRNELPRPSHDRLKFRLIEH